MQESAFLQSWTEIIDPGAEMLVGHLPSLPYRFRRPCILQFSLRFSPQAWRKTLKLKAWRRRGDLP